MPKHTFGEMMSKTKTGMPKKEMPKKEMPKKEMTKMEKVMHEFKAGTLKSSSGELVTSRDQAIAIGMSEQREYDRKK